MLKCIYEWIYFIYLIFGLSNICNIYDGYVNYIFRPSFRLYRDGASVVAAIFAFGTSTAVSFTTESIG